MEGDFVIRLHSRGERSDKKKLYSLETKGEWGTMNFSYLGLRQKGKIDPNLSLSVTV